MLRKAFIIASLALLPLLSFAQRVQTATGTYTYYAPMTVTPAQAELNAIDRTKIDIIEKAFGTVVGVSNYATVVNEGDDSQVSFLSLGESEVQGEWLETIGRPSIQHVFADNMQVVTVTLTGRIRELKTAKTDISAKVLRNGVTDKYESSQFKDGDDFYISFETPVDGYVAIYLYDLYGVNRLLPLKHSGHPAYYVSAGTKYVFFADGISQFSDLEKKNQATIHSDYGLTCTGESEVNRIYVVFSPNQFTTPRDELPDAHTAPATLSFEDFQHWLSRSRKRDRDMSLRIRDILIRK